MIALIIILLVTVTALAGLRLFAPDDLREGIGPDEFAMALALPILATFGNFYAVLIVGVSLLIAYLPALAGGARGRAAVLE